MAEVNLYALDFDGVICDSAVETGMTGWKVASTIWTDMPTEMPAEMIDLFRLVRPVMETGYEAALIMRNLFEGVSAIELLGNFSQKINNIIERDSLSVKVLKQQFGETRDRWIEQDLDNWIAMNPLFDGVADKIAELNSQPCYIITTKQERFVKQIFDANGIAFPVERIYGLDRNLSKQQILADLLNDNPNHTILFVEDRLPTLSNVLNDHRLNKVALFFADWGYNTAADKRAAKKLIPVTTISLKEMLAL